MELVRGGMKKYFEDKLASANKTLAEFVGKLHDDEGRLVSANRASHTFNWVDGVTVTTGEAMVWAEGLAIVDHREDAGMEQADILGVLADWASDNLSRKATYISSKSNLPSSGLINDGEVQAFAKVIDAIKWATIELKEGETV